MPRPLGKPDHDVMVATLLRYKRSLPLDESIAPVDRLRMQTMAGELAAIILGRGIEPGAAAQVGALREPFTPAPAAPAVAPPKRRK